MVRQRVNQDLEAASGPPLATDPIPLQSFDHSPPVSQYSFSQENTPERPASTATIERPAQSTQEAFSGPDGQCLLFAFPSGKKGECKAIAVPVYRPSKLWAIKRQRLEEADGFVPVRTPMSPVENPKEYIERWRKMRSENPGETEQEVWKRIKLLHSAHCPVWYKWLPFTRPILHERNLLVHSRKGDIFHVEVEPQIDPEARQIFIDRYHDHMGAKIDKRVGVPDCPTSMDEFGEVFAICHLAGCPQRCARLHHGLRPPRQEDNCITETFHQLHFRQEKIERWKDLLDCYNDPRKASTVFPLTQGRVILSCIYQGDEIENLELPDGNNATRGSLIPPPRRGLYIEYQFVMKKHEIGMAAVLCATILVVLLWKFATDSWSTGAGFASVFLTFVGLRIQWKKSAEEGKTKSIKQD